jgi:hypothetical protein
MLAEDAVKEYIDVVEKEVFHINITFVSDALERLRHSAPQLRYEPSMDVQASPPS